MPHPVKPDSSNDRLRERRDVPRTHAGTRLRTVLAAASLVLAVCEAASAQSKVQGSRVGTQVGGPRGGSSVLLPDSVRIGRIPFTKNANGDYEVGAFPFLQNNRPKGHLFKMRLQCI